MLRNWRIALAVASFLTGCSHARHLPVDDVSAVPNLEPRDRAQYVRFLKEPQHRAFATGAHGRFGWSSGRNDQFAAVLGAVYNCNNSGKGLCAAYAVDDQVVLGAYDDNAAASLTAVAALRNTQTLALSYANETRDDGATPRTSIHEGNGSGSTPLTIPGARTIVTRQVASALAGRDPPILIDVGNSWGGHDTLPGAIWMRGAGDDARDNNGALEVLFRALLASIASDRHRPLVIFCESSICWQSYNAALRAASDGYSRVSWYRGGVAAWRAAGLATVGSVLSAQLW